MIIRIGAFRHAINHGVKMLFKNICGVCQDTNVRLTAFYCIVAVI